MKKIIFLLIFLGWATSGQCAELLVKNNGHWMDSLTQSEVDKMTEGQKESYEARSQKGDVIVVRPDGWAWGKEECAPNFIIVKVPNMTESEAKVYEQPLTEEVTKTVTIDGKSVEQKEQKLIRVRKYALPSTDLSSASKGVLSLTKTSLTTKAITKTGLSSEISAPKTGVLAFYIRKIQPYLAVARTFWVENAYAATQLKKTVKPSGGDYTSLEACMNANEQNLVTADKYFDVEIDGTWSSADTSAVTIHNYTTDATRYINIYTTGTARHSSANPLRYLGTSTAYALSVTDANCLTVTSNNITIDGLQFYPIGTTQYTKAVYVSSYVTPTTIKNNIFKGTTNLRNQFLYFQNTNGSTNYSYNNLFYNGTGAWAQAIGGTGGTANNATHLYWYNNTVYNMGDGEAHGGGLYSQGYVSGGHMVITNNLVMGKSAGCDIVVGTMSAGATNATSDATGDDSPLTGGQINKTSYTDYFVSVTAGSEDFHLKATCEFIGDGTDLGSPYNTDIDGDTRSGTWDIGADEYVASGGGTIQNIRNSIGDGICNGLNSGMR